MRATFPRFLHCVRGTTAIEYAMVAALIAVVLVVAVGALGGTLKGTIHKIEAALPQSGNSGGGNGNGNNGNGNGNSGTPAGCVEGQGQVTLQNPNC
jgi:Flp pilus assembly pilin Flp